MTLTRRQLLAGAAGAVGASSLASCARAPGRSGHTSPVTPTAATRHDYGADPSQFGELYRPKGTAHPGTVVVIHGGFWRAAYDLTLGGPLAKDLAARGFTAWNLEYRRVGSGGGWPGTLADVAAGLDALAGLDVDTSRVVAIGHSAGGQLAVWAAGRSALAPTAPGASPRVHVTGAVAQAGVLDLATAADAGVGGTAVADFLGGAPNRVPQHYAVADPIGQVPLAAPVLCVHSRADTNVPFAQSSAYVAAATKSGAVATLHETAGDHFTLIDPSSPDWAIVLDALPRLLSP
ncbi:MAG: alpha/beta hydrolase [Pseudonocardiales bacterium]|nr:MAG: alpha/beta hydrolase [Pseudonocardiales bacterium]